MTKATYFSPFCFPIIFTSKDKSKVLCFFDKFEKKIEKFQEKDRNNYKKFGKFEPKTVKSVQ